MTEFHHKKIKNPPQFLAVEKWRFHFSQNIKPLEALGTLIGHVRFKKEAKGEQRNFLFKISVVFVSIAFA